MKTSSEQLRQIGAKIIGPVMDALHERAKLEPRIYKDAFAEGMNALELRAFGEQEIKNQLAWFMISTQIRHIHEEEFKDERLYLLAMVVQAIGAHMVGRFMSEYELKHPLAA